MRAARVGVLDEHTEMDCGDAQKILGVIYGQQRAEVDDGD